MVFACSQALRSLPKPLQSWKPDRTTLTTEVALEFVDREAAVISFPLQDTKGDQTAGEIMPLRPLRARLTAAQAELIFTDSNDLFYPAHRKRYNHRTSAAVNVRRLVA